MLNVQILKQADKAVEEFKAAYAKRYGHIPILTNPIELQLFLKGLIGKAGYEHTVELIRYFMKNDGDRGWWRTKGHSASTFKFEIEAINAAFALTKKSAPQSQGPGYSPSIQFETTCPDCNATHHIVCKAIEADKHAYTKCKACRESV